MVAFTYSRVIAANYNTTPPTVAKSATGSVYAIADTTFTTPLNLTLVVGGVTTTSISADSSGIFPDFTVNDRTSVVWKQAGSPFSTVLTTTDPVPGPKGDPGNSGSKGDKGDRGDLAAWQPTTFYPLNQVLSDPLGNLVRVTTAHTSGASYDATKFEYAVPPTLTPTALSATYLDKTSGLSKAEAASTYASTAALAGKADTASLAAKADKTEVVPKWKPGTAYTAGQPVISPTGDVVTAKVDFTSGTSFDPANWNLSASYVTPAGVTQALAADTTVKDAAASAVTANIAGRKLIEDGDTRIPEVNNQRPDLLVAITDSNFTPTWLQARASDGGPSDDAMAAISARIPIVGGNNDTNVPGVLVGIADANDNRTWLEANTVDGGPTDLSVQLMRRALGSASASQYVADGDSITQGGQGVGSPWPTLLAAKINKPVINLGRSGTTPVEIAMRTGGITILVTLPGGVIPADTTPVSVTTNLTGPWTNNAAQPDRITTGKIRGIPCSLVESAADGSFKFVRTTAGTAVSVANPVAFIPDTPYDDASTYRHILWSGRNGWPKVDHFPVIDAQLQRWRRLGVQFLVVSVTNTTSEPAGSANYSDIMALNAKLLNAWPEQYVDMRGRLIREGLALAGLTATAQDNIDIANDCIPTSLLYDTLHPNGDGRVAASLIMYDELKIRGWES